MLGAELGLPDSRRRKNVFLEPKISMMENSMDLRVLWSFFAWYLGDTWGYLRDIWGIPGGIPEGIDLLILRILQEILSPKYPFSDYLFPAIGKSNMAFCVIICFRSATVTGWCNKHALHFTPSSIHQFPAIGKLFASCPFESLVRDDEDAMATSQKRNPPGVGKGLPSKELILSHIYITWWKETPKKSPPNGRGHGKCVSFLHPDFFFSQPRRYVNKLFEKL